MELRTFMGGVGMVLAIVIGLVITARVRTEHETLLTGPNQSLPLEGRPRREPTEHGFLGVIIVEESVDIASRVDAQIESIRVQVGDSIRQGSVLATLDARTMQQELAVAEAELRSARAEREVVALALAEAQEKLKRREDPRQIMVGAISEEELSTARYGHSVLAAKLEAARAQVQEHEARVAQFRRNISEVNLRAPFDGVVAARNVHTGELVRPGQVLFHLLKKAGLRVHFAMPEQQARHVEAGTPIRVAMRERGLLLAGSIVLVAPEIDIASGMVFAVAKLNEEPGSQNLPSGTVVRVMLERELAGAWDKRRDHFGEGAP